MASNINPYNIDGTFPVAGQDNSSQGFRDNFTNIKNNFTYAQNELTDLQNKSILTSALNGQTINNDMAGTQIKRPQLDAWTQSLIDKGPVVTGTTTYLDFGSTGTTSNGATFQKFSTSGDPGTIGVSLVGWPTSTGTGALGYGVMRVWIYVSSPYHTVTLDSSVSIGIYDIAGSTLNPDGTSTISFDTPGDYIFDFSSTDGGNTFLIFDVTRNRISFRDPSFYFNKDSGTNAFLIGFGDALNLAIELSTPDTLQLRGSQTNYAGVLEHGNDVGVGINSYNPQYAALGGNINVAGYSVATSRAYLDNTGMPVLNTVIANDFIGYYNFLAATSNPANIADLSINEFATIRGFVTGTVANVLLDPSPGGNIWIGTKKDLGVAGSSGNLTVAMTIENDQSSNFYGNVNIYGNVSTTGRRVDTGFTVQNFITNASSGNTYVIPNNVNTVIVDTDGINGNISYANIELPRRAINGQTVKLVFMAPIIRPGTTGGANIYPGSYGSPVIKYLPSTYPNIAGNTAMTFTYVSTINGAAANVWYRT